MASEKISALPAASALDGTELVPIVQGGVTRRTTVSAWPPAESTFSGAAVSQSAVTIADDTDTFITFDFVLYDTDGYFSSLANDRLTFPFTGYYSGTIEAGWDTNVDGYREVNLEIIGHNWVGGIDLRQAANPDDAGINSSSSFQTERVLAGEFIRASVRQTSGVDLSFSGALSLTFQGDRAPPPPPPGTVLFDSMTGTNGEDVNGRPLEVGGVDWAVVQGAATIESNTADWSATSANNSGYALAESGISDCTVTVTLTVVDTAGQGNNGLSLRGTDGSNLWYVDLLLGAGVDQIRIVERNGGSDNVRATTPVTGDPSAPHTIVVVLAGSSISADLDSGAFSVNYPTATFQQTATKHGLAGRMGSGVQGTRHVNFRVQN